MRRLSLGSADTTPRLRRRRQRGQVLLNLDTANRLLGLQPRLDNYDYLGTGLQDQEYAQASEALLEEQASSSRQETLRLSWAR